MTRLDVSGITLAGRKFGLEMSRINHDFKAVNGGTQYISTLTIGTAVPGLRPVLNPLVHKTMFTEAMGRAWLRHNVEEVGLLEHMIPLLYPGGARG